MIRRPPRSTPKPSSAASDVYKRQGQTISGIANEVGPGGQFSSYSAAAAGATTLYAPIALNSAAGGFTTGMGSQNTTGTAGTVMVTYWNASGMPVKTVTKPIPAGGYVGLYQGSATDGPPPGSYAATLTSTVPIAMVVNEVGPGSRSTAYNPFTAGLGTVHLPLVEAYGPDGWSTGEGIMNTGTSPTTVTVTTYKASDGSLLGAQTDTLGPHAVWDVYQPSTALPVDTRATAVVSAANGGQVAVVCNEQSASTFMSYDGQ